MLATPNTGDCLLKSLETANFTITVLPEATPALTLAPCGMCGRETYVTMTVSDDRPGCCRQCFRARRAPAPAPARTRNSR